MKLSKTLFLATALALGGLTTTPTFGLVELKITLPKAYADSSAVLVGSITKIQKETGDVDIAIKDAINGVAFGERARLAIKLPALVAALAENDAVVLLPSQRDPNAIVVNVAGHWLYGKRPAGAKALFAVSLELPDLAHTYPGSATTLATLFKQIKDGKQPDLTEKADPRILTGGIKDLGKLPVTGATAMVAGDFNGDKKLHIAIATAAGVKVFSYDGKAFAESDAKAPAGFPAPAAPALKANDAGEVLASATGDFGEAGQSLAIVVRAKGIARESIGEKEGQTADDFKRLTGDALSVFLKGFEKGVPAAIATSIDLNGDGRRDVVLFTDEGGIAMINRGYGAFFVVPGLAKTIVGEGKTLPFAVGKGTLLSAADLQGNKRESLIALTAEGQVFAVENPAPAK